MTQRVKLGTHHLRIKAHDRSMDGAPDVADHAEEVRSWLTALVGAEHLSLLVGSGLGIGVATALGARGLDMSRVELGTDEAVQVDSNAEKVATMSSVGEANFEDQLRSALALLAGLEVLEPEGERAIVWRKQLAEILGDFAKRGLEAEQAIRQKITTPDLPWHTMWSVRWSASFSDSPVGRPRERSGMYSPLTTTGSLSLAAISGDSAFWTASSEVSEPILSGLPP